MTTNYSESGALSTETSHRCLLFYGNRKGYKQKLFHQDKSLFQSFQSFKPFHSFKEKDSESED